MNRGVSTNTTLLQPQAPESPFGSVEDFFLSPLTPGTKISFVNLSQYWSEYCHSKIASEDSWKHRREIEGYSGLDTEESNFTGVLFKPSV